MMRISRFVTVVSFITCFSLLYVYQQSEIFRLAYVGQKNQVSFQDLLDKNTILRYNIERNASLISIGNKISKEKDFQMPDSYRLVKLSPTKEGFRISPESPSKQTLIARIFGIRSQAEAEIINP
ncbi:MAG: hypothetical protein ABSE81_00890 [Candidatus Omnitrophota bacterium]|jgi:hypothetical protein